MVQAAIERCPGSVAILESPARNRRSRFGRPNLLGQSHRRTQGRSCRLGQDSLPSSFDSHPDPLRPYAVSPAAIIVQALRRCQTEVANPAGLVHNSRLVAWEPDNNRNSGRGQDVNHVQDSLQSGRAAGNTSKRLSSRTVEHARHVLMRSTCSDLAYSWLLLVDLAVRETV